jgi:hypothetical protein
VRDFNTTKTPMKLTDLIPYLKNEKKWDNLLVELNIDTNSEEILIYALHKLDINSDILLIELEKTDDNLEIYIEGNKYVQFFPYSLAHELTTIDFVNLETDSKIAQRLIEYSINDA